jgi:proton-translocating NAD(P)+ transhydrogenase subunit alpha
MNVAVPNEVSGPETRVAMVPANVAKLVQAGARVFVEAGLGQGCDIPDSDYEKAGAGLVRERRALFGEAELVLRIHPPSLPEVDWLPAGAVHVSLLDPFARTDCVRALAERGLSALSLEMIPRVTRAQKMDVLSSQASLAGYVAVIAAARHLPKIFPLMMTAAGTMQPARVLVVGAGVAGLQAIATAHRLGAIVQAYDTRPAVEQEARSLGARFVKLDLGETGQTKEGYARALTEAQLQKQREALGKVCAQSDVVITAAQVFGRRAPVVVTRPMLAGMPPGSVVVDLALEQGGNVEGAAPDDIVQQHGVRILGFSHPAARVPVHASLAFSNNVTALIETFWDREKRRLELPADDEIVRACLITQGGRVCHPQVLERIQATEPAAVPKGRPNP